MFTLGLVWYPQQVEKDNKKSKKNIVFWKRKKPRSYLPVLLKRCKNHGFLYVLAVAPRRNAHLPVASDTDHLRKQKNLENKTKNNIQSQGVVFHRVPRYCLFFCFVWFCWFSRGFFTLFQKNKKLENQKNNIQRVFTRRGLPQSSQICFFVCIIWLCSQRRERRRRLSGPAEAGASALKQVVQDYKRRLNAELSAVGGDLVRV